MKMIACVYICVHTCECVHVYACMCAYMYVCACVLWQGWGWGCDRSLGTCGGPKQAPYSLGLELPVAVD